jgi:glycosyltransferase involved in cell wall biosynthesis
MRDGVDVRRLPLSSFGKSSIPVRLLAQCCFLLQAVVRGLFLRGLCGIMVSTSPPFCGAAGALISKIRRVPVKYWLMDLNPDQMVAMRILPPGSILVRLFEAMNRLILQRASDIIVMDRFMKERVCAKLEVGNKIHVMPPWPHTDGVEDIEHEKNEFRMKHVPGGKFVVMYSGNHSPANPLTTLLAAVREMQADSRLLLMCIGGGNAKKEVDQMVAQGVSNICSLPYQPLSAIRYSLSAADVHVISIGEDVVGMVHPCKVYGAMAVSRPILLLGPSPSHIADLIERYDVGWKIAHGDVAGARRVLEEILATPVDRLRAMGRRAAETMANSLSREILLASFCDVLERGLSPRLRAVSVA